MPRLARAGQRELSVPEQGPWRLAAGEGGTLESLSLIEAPEASRPLEPSEVRVSMQAAGLNFRDVLIALGVYPVEASVGSEGAGVVLEVGPAVNDLLPGDRVFGLFPGAFGPQAVADQSSLALLPQSWSFAEGASVSIVFATAYYGLIDLADLKPGERVLIHAGAGGVGMAAIQIARHLGAEVFATASPGKWDALRGLGLDDDHIASSRTLEFKEKFLQVTGGAGLDVVLDALAREFVDASLELLPNGGRFIEMGKADIREPEQIASEHPGVSYRAFDLTQAGPARGAEIHAELLELFEQGALEHAPITSWDIRHGVEAFRFLSQARHIGKVVLTLPQQIDPEGTVLITGGLTGLGALSARHLASAHGAKHLLLLSRRGPDASGAAELIAELGELGCEARAVACDVSDREALEKVLAEVPAKHPLTAIVHSAGVLDDALIADQSRERLKRVLAPKADAAWHLHELTKGMELSAFVLFSSAAATIGSPGQGNYAAANSFLDALAHRRQAEGLTATSIAWGLWEQESELTASLEEADLARLSRVGLIALSDEAGLELFDRVRSGPDALAVAAPMETAALRGLSRAGVLPPVLTGLVRSGARRRAKSSTGSLARRLAGVPEAEREAAVLSLVREHVATVLGHSSAELIDPQANFKDLGFDSLGAVELRNRLAQATGVALEATLVFDYPTPGAVSAHLLGLVEGKVEASVVVRAAKGTDEPIAIVGLSCRYPGGASSPEGLWELVAEGRDGITDFPVNRGWDTERLYDPDPERVGKTYTREGGFLHDAADFDPAFFGISPREAVAMDPQQRLLLECAWEALEDAGIDPAALRGSSTGVFAGVMASDYAGIGAGSAPAELEGYLGIGVFGSIVSGRLAYTLGLEGPAVSVDTACSSSLVAIHLAAQALRGGECELALAGGVMVMPSPLTFIGFSRQRGLSPDGRCKSFAAAADGTGVSEGSGLLLLQRLSDAKAAGHRIHAVIRGSATNQDGASNGLTAPNGPAQERVIRQALANAGLKPSEVDAVEAHGTGTTLGDPIEAQALLATYGQERENGPLALGSLKSNIGHTQAAAGVGGVIKMVLALRNEELPRTLHVDEPTPHVDWEAGEIELLREAKEWPKGERPRRAGVSSFGISGTNAHLILEEAPEAPKAKEAGEKTAPPAIPWALSAKTPEALQEAAGRLAAHVEARSPDPIDVAHTLLSARASFSERAVVVGADQAELLAGLDALAQGNPDPNLAQGHVLQGKTAFLLSGQGSQRPGMGRGLYEAFPVYAESFDRACEALEAELGLGVKETVFAPEGSEAAASLDRTDLTQASIFALQVALFELLTSFGLAPDYLIGHSIGEIGAAHLSGVLSLKDAAKLVASRGSLMAALPEGGAMAAVRATEQEAEESLAGFEGKLGIAAINGPASIVVSGDEDALIEWQERQRKQGRKTRRLRVSHAFHSQRMEPMLKDFEETAASLDFRAPRVPILSNLSAELLSEGQAASPAYWAAHVREPVRFADGIAALAELGVSRYLELGPDATLTGLAAESIEDPEPKVLIATALRKGRPEPQSLISLLGAAHASGAKVDWAPLFAGTGATITELPTYPFQRERFWLTPSAGAGDASALGLSNAEHPLLGASIAVAGEERRLFTGAISHATHPWLADHAVTGTAILPGTAFVELALRAGAEVGAEHLTELILEAPLLVPESGAVQLQLVLTPAESEEGGYEIAIYSRLQKDEAADAEDERLFTRHASGTLTSQEPATPDFDATAWPPPGAEPIDIEAFYDFAAEAGLDYGPAFQGLTAAWRAGSELFAEVSLAPEQVSEAQRFGIHPALLDAALHPALLDADPGEGLRLPFSFGGISLHEGAGASALRVRVSAKEGQGFLVATDPEGAPVVSIASLTARSIDPAQLQLPSKEPDSLFALEWTQVELPEVEDIEPEIHRESQALLGAFAAEQPPKLVVYAPQSAQDENPALAANALTAEALEVVQAFLAAEHLASSRLAILTEGAMAIEAGESPDLAAASLWGLVRSAQSEHPGRLTLIDSDGSEASAAALPAALAIVEEPQLALREGVARVPRLARAGQRELSVPEQGPWRLAAGEGGTLESLSLIEAPEASRPLEPSEVRVSMQAAGLNFRDVLIALGVYPVEASVGSEGAGVVLEVGPAVNDLLPGDRVFGLFPGAFGPQAVADQSSLALLPQSWSFAEGASVSIVFATAYYGLIDLADLKPGERVLIHAGAGGVGMAAIQIARHLGAEVFATASPGKWDALRGLGLDDDHIASSRTLEFKEKFLQVTGGAGLDVVLDALAREFVDASLELLPNGGRFIEMGKADIREPEQIASEHPGVSYRAFDLTQAGPARGAEIHAELLELFEQGALEHAPITSWDIRHGVEAFRFLSQARHIGKVVLTLPQQIDPEGTVLITGGLTGLGALSARHLASAHGAKHLLLLSRRGPDASGAAELIAELGELGCEARAVACDVSDREALEKVLAEVPAKHPLTAIVHSAGVLDDALIADQSRERLKRVLAPKADAAWHLHELTKGMELSAFVLFSSAAATIGSPGQGNYAAANSFLDALAHRRQAEGLTATSIAWGLWEQESELTASLEEADLARLSRVGLIALSDEAGLELFDRVRSGPDALAVAAPMETAALRGLSRAGVLPPVLTGLVRSGARRRAKSSTGSLARRLAGVPEAEREAAVLSLVREHVATVLGHSSADSVELERPLLELGLDSLGAVELRNRLSDAAGMHLPGTVVFDYPTTAALAVYLLAKVEDQGLGGEDASGFDRGAVTAEGATLRALITHAHGQGRGQEVMPLLTEISKFHPVFRSIDELDEQPRSIQISTVGTAPRLICVPSFIVGSGPHQFVKIARAIEGRRAVTALSLPGAGRGESLPASWNTAIDVPHRIRAPGRRGWPVRPPRLLERRRDCPFSGRKTRGRGHRSRGTGDARFLPSSGEPVCGDLRRHPVHGAAHRDGP